MGDAADDAEEEAAPHMTKYEACELVAGRAMLLAAGAPSALTPDELRALGTSDVVKVACREVQLRRVDAQIVRAGVAHAAPHMRLPDSVRYATIVASSGGAS